MFNLLFHFCNKFGIKMPINIKATTLRNGAIFIIKSIS